MMSNVFRTIDNLTINKIKDVVYYAILNYEPRITLHTVEVIVEDVLEGRIKIKLDYTIRKINVRTNVVYPFYINEGTNVKGM